jgi:hypothetical protein
VISTPSSVQFAEAAAGTTNAAATIAAKARVSIVLILTCYLPIAVDLSTVICPMGIQGATRVSIPYNSPA